MPHVKLSVPTVASFFQLVFVSRVADAEDSKIKFLSIYLISALAPAGAGSNPVFLAAGNAVEHTCRAATSALRINSNR